MRRGAGAALAGLLVAGLVAGCSTPAVGPGGPALPPVQTPMPQPESAPASPPAQPGLPPDVPVVSPGSRPQSWASLDAATLRRNIGRLLPARVRDRNGWAADLQAAYAHLKLPQEPGLYCATIALIEQESSFQADPVVPGLPAMVWRELAERSGKYGVPKALIKAAMGKASPDGRSYRQRIDRLKTEREVSELYEDMVAEIPFGKRLLTGANPVRTGGPMQVSVDFAVQHSRATPYPYPIARNLRGEVFSRRGGLYFGTAILLDYPAPYDDVVYRFADFNAGRYSSRNAAFQAALGRLAGKALSRDGDLLRYRNGQVLGEPGSVETALRGIARRLGLSPAEIRRDLLLEKTADFNETRLYGRVFALADQAAGKRLPRQAMPEIDLKSPKITRKLTTEWFARRVEGRFRNCLERIDAAA